VAPDTYIAVKHIVCTKDFTLQNVKDTCRTAVGLAKWVLEIHNKISDTRNNSLERAPKAYRPLIMGSGFERLKKPNASEMATLSEVTKKANIYIRGSDERQRRFESPTRKPR